jgi:hypothetical protein
MPKSNVISEEAAQQQIDLLLDFYDIDLDESEDEGDIGKAMQMAVKKLTRYIRKGLVEINDSDGLQVIQHLKHSRGETKTISYGIVDGKSKMAMSKAGEKDYSGKIYHLMGSLANIPASSISQLQAVDSNVVECLGAIFLAG